MASWSAENATKAYLTTLKMEKRAKKQEVDVADVADSIALALVAAAHQTGGRVVCILRGTEELRSSKEALGKNSSGIVFVTGEAQNLLLNIFLEADFVLIDCNLRNHEEILRAMQGGGKPCGSIVLGYNASYSSSWRGGGLKAQLLPIGGGLFLYRIAESSKLSRGGGGSGKSDWLVKVDEFTGEEHVFRVRSPQGKGVEA
ncbi:hypothetical protein NMG60_11012281 [Bertholletia excelsa]